MAEVIVCDYCAEQLSRGSSTWLTLEHSGVDMMRLDELPGPFHFCSMRCLAGWSDQMEREERGAEGAL